MTVPATAGHGTRFSDGSAVGILGPDETGLLRELDAVFARWAAESGAREIIAPPIYPVSDLEKFDVYQNFPHLAFVASPLDVSGPPPEPVGGTFGRSTIQPPALGLPHATCYGAYLYFEGRQVPASTTVTLVNRCFRREERYEGLRRLLTFHMREIVAIGSFEHTQDVIARFTGRIESFGDGLALGLRKAVATDPFFERGGSRALLQRVSPVKHEFRADGLAIASVNTHRNFFGERCAIEIAGSGGEHAFTSCVAFGLERWLAVLGDHCHGDLGQAAEAVRAAS